MKARKMHAKNLQDVIDIMKWGTGMTVTEPLEPKKKVTRKPSVPAPEPVKKRPVSRRGLLDLKF